MKTLSTLMFLAAMFFSGTAFAQATETSTLIEFAETEFNFGTITQGDKAEASYKFTNTGSQPLLITNAKGSCGCTVPEWPKEAIMPGETSEIKAVFNSKGKKGLQSKRITITANTDPAQTYLTIKGEVLIPAVDPTAPSKSQEPTPTPGSSSFEQTMDAMDIGLEEEILNNPGNLESPNAQEKLEKLMKQPTSAPVAIPTPYDGPTTAIEFDNPEFDFGEINEGDKVEHIYTFLNTGTEPLLITNAKGSCGCTVPTWPKEAIMPGESGEIHVKFNSKGKKNKQSKRVTITANTDPVQSYLTIKGMVNPVDKK